MKRYKINKKYIVQKIEDKITIFDSDQSILFTLNNTAATIFEGIKFGLSQEKIAEKLSIEFDTLQSEAKKDIETFTEELKKKKVIIPV